MIYWDKERNKMVCDALETNDMSKCKDCALNEDCKYSPYKENENEND